MFCNVFFPANAFLGHEGWIGCNSVQNPQVVGFPDLIQVRSIDKKFHIIDLIKFKKKWQVTYIAPLNHLPLLPSGPGGFSRSWPYKTCQCKGRSSKPYRLSSNSGNPILNYSWCSWSIYRLTDRNVLPMDDSKPEYHSCFLFQNYFLPSFQKRVLNVNLLY